MKHTSRMRLSGVPEMKVKFFQFHCRIINPSVLIWFLSRPLKAVTSDLSRQPENNSSLLEARGWSVSLFMQPAALRGVEAASRFSLTQRRPEMRRTALK